MTEQASEVTAKVSPDLEQLVKESDFGGREPAGAVGIFLAIVAAAWSLFQVWYASPLPFVIGHGIFNDTEARAVHLAFSVFLAFAAFPAFRASSRKVVPWTDWILAAVGAFCAAYLYLYYNELAGRPGKPTAMDMTVGLIGVGIMLEATRRAMGMGMLITTGLFLIYIFAGPLMPEVIQHKGATVQRFTWDGEGDGEGDGEQVSCVSESPVGTLCTSCAPSGTSSDPTFRTRIR